MDVFLRMDKEDLAKSVDYKFLSTWKQWRNEKVAWDECRYMTLPLFDLSSWEDAEKK